MMTPHEWACFVFVTLCLLPGFAIFGIAMVASICFIFDIGQPKMSETGGIGLPGWPPRNPDSPFILERD